MTIQIKFILVLVLFIFSKLGFAQTSDNLPENILSFEEYLGYVKQHHPLMKQANLILSIGEANMLKNRGGFDPKIEVDYDRKKFKKTEYFDQFNATFKVPTWYGIEFKANFEQNTGEYLNPNLTVPDDGLYSAGVSFSLAQGLLMNKRMASLKKARYFKEQSKNDRDLLVNNLLFEASKAYFDWVEATNEQHIYDTFLENATARLEAVKISVKEGGEAAIDITEARIILHNRQLSFEVAMLKRKKATLIASTFLWVNDIPMEIQDNVIPEIPRLSDVQTSLFIKGITNTDQLVETHPKLLSLDAKINGLTIDKRLKQNKLLPKIDLQYNFLSPKADPTTLGIINYKAFVNFSFPLFLRKERGDLKLAKLKLQNANLEVISTSLNIRNKIDAADIEIESLVRQNELITSIVKEYTALVKAEERKFSLGESSLFLINSREQKLIDSKRKENVLIIKQLNVTAKLYNILGITGPMNEEN